MESCADAAEVQSALAVMSIPATLRVERDVVQVMSRKLTVLLTSCQVTYGRASEQHLSCTASLAGRV